MESWYFSCGTWKNENLQWVSSTEIKLKKLRNIEIRVIKNIKSWIDGELLIFINGCHKNVI